MRLLDFISQVFLFLGALAAGRQRDLPLRRDVQDDRASQVEPRIFTNVGQGRILFEHDDLTYEKMIASRCGIGQEAGRHGGLPLRIVFCLLLMLLPVSAVGGQEPTTRLFFNPTPLEIDTTISPTGVVTLEVADGVDIFAFDLFVHYDPALLSVSQVTLGDFLGEGLLILIQVNDPGLVHYACTRFDVDTGVSGSGVVLELTFEAFGQAGETILSLANSQLFESQDAFPVDLTLEDGVVSVRPYRTYLPLIITDSGQGMGAVR